MIYGWKSNRVMKAQTTVPHAALTWLLLFDLILQIYFAFRDFFFVVVVINFYLGDTFNIWSIPLCKEWCEKQIEDADGAKPSSCKAFSCKITMKQTCSTSTHLPVCVTY